MCKRYRPSLQVGDYVKTDRKDARKLAFCLSKGLLNGIYIPDPADIDRRQILRTREGFKFKRIRVIARVKMLLLSHGYIHEKPGLSLGEVARLKLIDFPLNIKGCLDQYVEELEFINERLKVLDSMLTKAMNARPVFSGSNAYIFFGCHKGKGHFARLLVSGSVPAEVVLNTVLALARS